MEPVSERRWIVRESNPAVAEAIARDGGVAPLVARLLAGRGVSGGEGARRFLASTLADIRDPFLLKGMDEAVTRLAAALRDDEPVCVYGDYDVDGVSSTALLMGFFRSVGLRCFSHIPRRLTDGYGLSADGIRTAAAAGARVIVTVDCGITACAEADLCTSLGVDLIVTDHHTQGAALPRACAVINPNQDGCPYPFKALAGVGVAFNLAIALRRRLRATGLFAGRCEPNLREYLDLVALGTVADVVPLAEENRIFVKHGLKELTTAPRAGIRALKQVAGVTGEVGCGAVGFRLAPRLNAAGRLEDAALGVELLLEGDHGRAATIATLLDESNAERQEVEREILADALAQVKGDPSLREKRSIVLASETWHPGVIGIVASRLVDIFHRPTILIALRDGSGRGSGRSIAGFHLHDALAACGEHLEKFGGHRQAAGLSIDEATLDAFVARFEEVAAGLLTPEDLTPVLVADAELSPAEVTPELLEAVAALEPFGMGNPEPLFILRGAAVTERRILKEHHLKLRLAAAGRTFDAIGFNLAEQGRSAGDTVDVAFSLRWNEWNGGRGMQLALKDIREAR
ncbi:single-stranded-DNA-specific exonuclease RecJ [Geobacter pickeringii]|uniref:Single-stranded-DNA-specific exonuclease RecJ n=1 Tax=Geobacter pickeringii TaxID=345632 RepID=A0A0B5B7P2_9BACT|nr:single-stranded-DNA-specific exonuclease RecJ [Geobacter pickeringii]AJE02597.1 single-stranded DNA exonuclease [Geobacter pickeringii]